MMSAGLGGLLLFKVGFSVTVTRRGADFYSDFEPLRGDGGSRGRDGSLLTPVSMLSVYTG